MPTASQWEIQCFDCSTLFFPEKLDRNDVRGGSSYHWFELPRVKLQ